MMTMNFLLTFRSRNENPFLPGLEVYNVLKYAKKNNKEIYYGEKMFG